MMKMKFWLKRLGLVVMVMCLAFTTLSCALALENSATPTAENGGETSNGAHLFSAKGTIARPEAVTITAPMGGQVGDFAWVAGDTVEAGALAFSLTPTQVYAANDGVVTGLQAQAGDLAAAVQTQYGALCYIVREDVWHVNASTSSAYDDPKNRDVLVGDTLRVKSGTGNKTNKGAGTVISKNGRSFVLEMPRGTFEIEKWVTLYLGDTDTYKDKDQVGKGNIVRPALLPVSGEGVIAQVLVKNGDHVKRGQPLFTLDSASARYGGAEVKPEVRFETKALIGEVLVRPGQFVVQGQAVMTLLPMEGLEAALEVDELDIAKVSVGQTVRVSVDAYQGVQREGTVREIRPMGVTVLDTTKFVVKVAFGQDDDLMMGMHVTGYWD